MAIGEDTEANPFSEWLPDKSWAELGRIGDLPPRGQDTEHELKDFRTKFKENISEWKKDRVIIGCMVSSDFWTSPGIPGGP